MTKNLLSRRSALFVIALLFLPLISAFAAEPINTLEKKRFFGYAPNGIAIRGYDTVAYFTQSKPVKGSDSYTTQWMGATWKFSSQEHLDLFVAEPDKYAPQYGGYCAYGVAVGDLVKIEPEFWTIHNDKLYLNYNKKLNNTWLEDIDGYVSTADGEFDSLLKSQ